MATYRRLSAVRVIEAVVAVAIVFLMSNALIGPVLDPEQTGGDSIPALRLVWLPVYAGTFGLALLRLPQILRYWAPALALFVLVGWAFASTLWSIDPETSLRRAVAVAATTLFGLYLAASFGGRGMAEVLAFSFLVMALGSYFVCLAVPSLGVHAGVNAGDWRGLWYEKNQMGATMVYGAVSAVAAAITSPKRRWLWLLTLVLCSGLVLMTHSKTSLLALLLVLAGVVGLIMIGRGPAAAVVTVWLGVTGGGILAGIYFLQPAILFGAIGKDPTLTGRTDIWNAVLRASREEPLLGYGYAAFWGRSSAPAKWIREQLQWVVPTAHNGWLDLLIQLGQVGVALFGVVFATALAAAFVRLRGLRDGYWAVLFLLVYAMEILSESFILLHNSLPWVLAAAAMARVLGPAPAWRSAAQPAPIPPSPARSAGRGGEASWAGA